MMLVRSSGLIPEKTINPIKLIAQLLTVISMAALGLGVDIHSLKKQDGVSFWPRLAPYLSLAFVALS